MRVTADVRGLGSCTQSPVDNNSRILVEDEGTTIGIGATGPTVEGEACDWTTEVPGLPPADFYTLLVDGEELAQLALAEVEEAGWQVTLHVDSTGGVEVT